MPGRQERVNDRQGGIKTGPVWSRKPLTGSVIENLIAAVVGIALVAYLVYALVRPEKF